jgi:hypothetical protein
MVPLSLNATTPPGDTRPDCEAQVSDLASSLGRPVCTGLKKMKGLASHPWTVAQPAGQSLKLGWGYGLGERLCGRDANALAEELETLWFTALLLRVQEVFGRYFISLHSARSACSLTALGRTDLRCQGQREEVAAAVAALRWDRCHLAGTGTDSPGCSLDVRLDSARA